MVIFGMRVVSKSLKAEGRMPSGQPAGRRRYFGSELLAGSVTRMLVGFLTMEAQ